MSSREEITKLSLCVCVCVCLASILANAAAVSTFLPMQTSQVKPRGRSARPLKVGEAAHSHSMVLGGLLVMS